MIVGSIFHALWQNILDTSWLEVVAVLLGIASVWYARKENILVYPTGIISTAIYVFICFGAKLYADAGINFYYAAASIYGWYAWTHPAEDGKSLEISVNGRREQWLWILVAMGSYALIFSTLWIFKRGDEDYMNSYLPFTDSFTTALFLVGMILMARKKVENWIYWIIADVVSVPLYVYKGLVFTGLQYFIFLVLAVFGLIEWRRKYRLQQEGVTV
ncbi:MAG: nicotinamide mononucleotide transporter [Bacteroidetes bacterium]|nr:MAG: nicotinamide mononucleotide transporter [Bacteroidota bacterium]